MILQILIIHGLQIQGPMNIVSLTFSAISIVYGFGDYLSYVVQGDQAGAPTLGPIHILRKQYFQGLLEPHPSPPYLSINAVLANFDLTNPFFHYLN